CRDIEVVAAGVAPGSARFRGSSVRIRKERPKILAIGSDFPDRARILRRNRDTETDTATVRREARCYRHAPNCGKFVHLKPLGAGQEQIRILGENQCTTVKEPRAAMRYQVPDAPRRSRSKPQRPHRA